MIRLLMIVMMFVAVSEQLCGQAIADSVYFTNPDYCNGDTLQSKTLIGRRVKLWDEGEVYPTLDRTNFYKRLPVEYKIRGGEAGWGRYHPATGDTGVVVYVTKRKRGFDRNIFLVKVGENYVPVGCGDITDRGRADNHEMGVRYHRRDSIANVIYADGCRFKMRRVNGEWSDAGSDSLGRVSETYACDLITGGVDTVMLCRYKAGNGISPLEKSVVLWVDNGHGYAKGFFNNEKYEPVAGDVTECNVQSLINFFFHKRIDTVHTDPFIKYPSDHDMGYRIQLQTPSLFFRQRINDEVVRGDSNHIKAVWWKMVADQIATIPSPLAATPARSRAR